MDIRDGLLKAMEDGLLDYDNYKLGIIDNAMDYMTDAEIIDLVVDLYKGKVFYDMEDVKNWCGLIDTENISIIEGSNLLVAN